MNITTKIANMPELKIMMLIEDAHDTTRMVTDEASRNYIWDALEAAHRVVQDRWLAEMNGKH